MACVSLWILVIIYVQIIALVVLSQQETGFIYNGFREGDLKLDGIAEVLPGGLLQLTNTSNWQKGHAFFRKPFEFNSPHSLSFSTNFVLAMVPDPDKQIGHGIAFVISPSMDFSHAEPSQFLGLFNLSTNGSPSSHVLAVEFDTVLSAEFNDINRNHVGIDVNNLESLESAPASYFPNGEGKNKSVTLSSGDPIQAWIDYDGTTMILNVTVAPEKSSRPNRPLMSRFINLSDVFLENMYVGFGAATGSLVSGQYILGWSFNKGGIAQSLEISKLPRLPPRKTKSWKPSPWLIVLLVLLTIILMAIFGGAFLYRRNKYAEIREEWEKEYGPHRFSYKSLYKATEGFDSSELLGKGGFGEVYKGKLPLERQIAVKRVCHDAEPRMKQFVAEIVSMGSLKHRNLVPLLGYCRRKGELMLVSEYMPNGSLDQYLFTTRKPVLTWFQRLSILKGIASALDYLHRGANQVVLHRDIKASNIMLDAELNGRLGDFGMARIHEHGENPQTTVAVGTIGYMAPELTTVGTSTRTDVFAFGVFMLEVTCGRRPMDLEAPVEKRYLVKWVCECWKSGCLIDARDPRFRGDFSVQEVEMVLKLGLLCSQFIPECRPNMEQVVHYLNGDSKLPEISPYTPGIGMCTPISKAPSEIAASSQSWMVPSKPSPANSSMFVTHSIFYGDGR